MKRLFLLLNLLLITAAINAASWTPDVRAYASAVFSMNTADGSDRLPCRTAFALNLEASPLAVSFSSHRLSSGLRLSITSDSLEYMNTTLLGSDRGYNVRISGFFHHPCMADRILFLTEFQNRFCLLQTAF